MNMHCTSFNICTYAGCLELQITAQVRDFMEQIKL